MTHFHLKWALVAQSLLLASAACAQSLDTDRLKALEQKFSQSLSQIEQLQKRIAELEQRQPATATTSVSATSNPTTNALSSTTPVNARVDHLEVTVANLANSLAKSPTDVGLQLHGFMDVGYARANGNAPAYDKSGFRLGTFDLYLTPQLGDRVKGLVELAFEYNHDGVLATDLERLQLGYVVSDQLTLWAGRFHTPLGYWNTAFHHGAQIQTSITRPRFMGFEDQGGILPVHTVGLWMTGKFDTRLGRVNYDAFAGNSASLRDGTLNYNAAGYDHQDPAVGFNLGLSPAALPGLTVGLHGMQHKVNSTVAGAGSNGLVNLQVMGGYAFFESSQWELIAEYYQFNNTDLLGTAGTNTSTASFVQAGYQFLERWTGFARYEKASLNPGDPYFSLMNSDGGGTNYTTRYGSSYTQHTLGLRYDLDPRSAIKLQAEQIVDEGNANRPVNWLRAQYSLRF